MYVCRYVCMYAYHRMISLDMTSNPGSAMSKQLTSEHLQGMGGGICICIYICVTLNTGVPPCSILRNGLSIRQLCLATELSLPTLLKATILPMQV